MNLVVLTAPNNPLQKIKVTVVGGRIKTVDNMSGVYFPFVTGQHYNRSVETWAETHSFLFNGVDLERKRRKIFGIPVDQVPQGHPLRFVYPGKFR